MIDAVADSAPTSTDPEETLGRTAGRLILLAGVGVASGWLSFRAVAYAPVAEVHEEIWRYSPGVIYGLLWILLAWWPGMLIVRDRPRRSLLWLLAFLVGIAFSYAAAYESTIHFFMKVSSRLMELNGGSERPYLIPSGFVGGIAGGLGIACVLGILFRAFDSWAARMILCAAGAFLGSSLALWSPANDEGSDPRLMIFFLIWQGGMAVTIGAIDAWWRRSLEGQESSCFPEA